MSFATKTLLPKVTIITPTYNRDYLLPETIESIVSQDYPNIEYLIIDDGSTDRTKEIVQYYLKKHPKLIKYYYHENIGEAGTVNRGWDLATGDYAMIVCSDDPQKPTLISESVKSMESEEDIVVTYPNWTMIDQNGIEVLPVILKQYPYDYLLRKLHCFIGPGALINRKKVKKYVAMLRNPFYSAVSDLECWLRIGLLGKFKHIPKNLSTWRWHNGSFTMNNAHEMGRQIYLLTEEFFKRDYLPDNIKALEAKSKKSACKRVIVASITTSDYKNLCLFILKYIKYTIATLIKI